MASPVRPIVGDALTARYAPMRGGTASDARISGSHRFAVETSADVGECLLVVRSLRRGK